FFFEVLVEFFCGQYDRAGIAEVAEDEQAGLGDSHEAGRIRSVMTNERLAAGRIDTDELVNESRVAGDRITEKILPNFQACADDLADLGYERGGLDPHVVGVE